MSDILQIEQECEPTSSQACIAALEALKTNLDLLSDALLVSKIKQCQEESCEIQKLSEKLNESFKRK